MGFKGGIINGSMAVFYGAVTNFCLMLAMNQHEDMKKTCYVLGAIGVLLAIYWLATAEVMGIPILMVAFVHVGLAARAEHVAMQIGCTGLAVVAFVIGLLMLAAVKPMKSA
ncbi:MAG: hypothetical protein ACYCXF_03130 [Thermoleophilia bacterium]